MCVCVDRQRLDYEQQRCSAQRCFDDEQRQMKHKCLVRASHLFFLPATLHALHVLIVMDVTAP